MRESARSKKGVKKMKEIAIITYAKLSQVKLILQNKKNSYTAYALIEHDKDDTDTHCHIFIRFNSDRRGVDIQKWFENCTDINDKQANTRFESVKSRKGLIDYLTHKKNTEKAQYDESQIIWSDSNAKELLLEEQEEDNGYNALEKMLNNIPLRQIAKEHGRDFIRYYNSYKQLRDDIMFQERQKKIEDEQLKLIGELEQTKQELLFKVKSLENGRINPETGEIE